MYLMNNIITFDGCKMCFGLLLNGSNFSVSLNVELERSINDLDLDNRVGSNEVLFLLFTKISSSLMSRRLN